jgi:hypothetical protein
MRAYNTARMMHNWRLVYRSRNLFGIAWYPDWIEFEAEMGYVEQLEQGRLTVPDAALRPMGPLLKVPAVWWRRAGYRLFTWDWA